MTQASVHLSWKERQSAPPSYGGYASSAVVASGEPVTIRVDAGQLNYETDQAPTFTLTVSDGTHHSSQVITLNVADVNPMPQPDQADGFIAFSVAQDDTLTITEQQLVAGSFDPENEPLHIDADTLTVSSGTLTLVADGAALGSRSWTYDPVDDFVGNVSITARVLDEKQ